MQYILLCLVKVQDEWSKTVLFVAIVG